MGFAATDQYGSRSVRILMAELDEAEIRARIQRARKEAGLSQPEMAELLGVIPRSVQNYENHHVPWGRIRDIADITGQSTRWLLHGEEAEQTPDVMNALAALDVKLSAVLVQLGARDVEELEPPGEEQPPARVPRRRPPQ